MSRRKAGPSWRVFSSQVTSPSQVALSSQGPLAKLASITSSQANVTCTLLKSRTKWGTANNPYPENACLLYLRLDFWQFRDCQFRMANAEIVFQTPNIDGYRPVVIDCNPGGMSGEAYQEDVQVKLELNPQIDVQGLGGSVGMVAKDTKSTHSSRWSFSVQAQPDELNGYNRLVWKWENQQRGSDVPFSRPIIVAIVLDHDHQPFTVNAQITAKLKTSFRHGFRNFKLIPVVGPSIPIEPVKLQTPPDLTAEIASLQTTMEEENRNLAPTGKSQWEMCKTGIPNDSHRISKFSADGAANLAC